MMYKVYEACQAASQGGFFFFQWCAIDVRVCTSPYITVRLKNACKPVLLCGMYTLYTVFQVSIEIPLKPLTRFFPT